MTKSELATLGVSLSLTMQAWGCFSGEKKIKQTLKRKKKKERVVIRALTIEKDF